MSNFSKLFHVESDLSDEEYFEVLQAFKKCHDATHGICWDVIECHAEDLSPEDNNE